MNSKEDQNKNLSPKKIVWKITDKETGKERFVPIDQLTEEELLEAAAKSWAKVNLLDDNIEAVMKQCLKVLERKKRGAENLLNTVHDEMVKRNLSPNDIEEIPVSELLFKVEDIKFFFGRKYYKKKQEVV